MYDYDKYLVMTNDLLQLAQSFYMIGIPYVGDTILRDVTDSSVRGYYSAPEHDTVLQSNEYDIMQEAMGLMKHFNPGLLEQYGVSSQ